jgi:hypothetical protein
VKAKFPDWFVAICEQKNCADTLEVDMEGRLPVDPKIPSTDDAEYAMNFLALKENRMAMSLLNTALVGDALGINRGTDERRTDEQSTSSISPSEVVMIIFFPEATRFSSEIVERLRGYTREKGF